MVDFSSQCSPIVDHKAINANSSFVEEVATQEQSSLTNEGIPVNDTPMHEAVSYVGVYRGVYKNEFYTLFFKLTSV